MKASQIKKALNTTIGIKQPVFIWGPPGVGKSNVIAQVADEMNLELRDVRAVLLDPVDLRGLPSVNNGTTSWNPPDFLPTEGEGVLFLDELNAAPPMVQAACYQLVLDRKLGDYEVPDGWTVMAAGNREGDRAVTSRMPSALANRFIHVDFDVDLEDWVSWALKSNIQTEIIAFLRFRPELLHDFDPAKGSRSFASPRSWEFMSRTLEAKPSKDIELTLAEGTIGEGAASELTGFLRIFRSLPDPDSVIMDPTNAIVPDDPATLFALCAAIAGRARTDNFERVVQYSERLSEEFSVMMIRDAARRDTDLTRTRGFIEWASNHSDILS